MMLENLKDHELVAKLSDLLIEEQERLVLQLEYLAELDRRKLFFEYSSLWAYLVHEHEMEEATAERRIRAARMIRRFPWIADLLHSGKLNISLLEIAQGVATREKLSDEDFSEAIHAISGMSCRNARKQLASMHPEEAQAYPDRIRPLTEELSEIRFVASQELVEKLDEIRGLLAHSHPGATLGELIDVIATEYRTKHHPEQKAQRAQKKNTGLIHSPSTSRVPPAPLVHALVQRDQYRCSYRDSKTGRRCDSKHGLEIDHKIPWSRGGQTELKNLRFLCANHHARVSFLEFGDSAKYFSK